MRSFLVFTLVILAGIFSVNAQIFNQTAIFHKNIEPLYRKPTKKELKAVEPKAELLTKYAEFLRQPKTGLTKLISDDGCAENTKIIVATENCLNYTMPGAGYAYSFRVRTYRLPRLADIIFSGGGFQAAGVLLHGIFVNIGDVPLERVDLQTKGMSFLINFKPEPDYRKARELDQKLVKGIENDGFLYRRGLFAKENTTFVLRSIAYNGKYFQAVNGLTYDEFAFDKRADIIVAFRIVDKDKAGNLTILWRILADVKSPQVKRLKDN